jgi:hypothetical protein
MEKERPDPGANYALVYFHKQPSIQYQSTHTPIWWSFMGYHFLKHPDIYLWFSSSVG